MLSAKPNRPVVIHNEIERDKRLKWHPTIQLRHKGVIIYACTAVKGYLQQAKAVAVGMQETEALLNG